MKPCREPELRRQLRTIVRVWEGRQGRESAKLAVLSALADHFGDLGDPRTRRTTGEPQGVPQWRQMILLRTRAK